jgi:alcohol dehydrogenase
MSYNRQSRYEPQPFQLNIPTRIYAGKGESERIGDIAACHGKRALVVSMRDLSGLAERAKERLEGAKIAVQLVLLENGEPTCAHIDSLKGPLRSHAADIIIGIGGGTAIDTAKALAIALTHPDQIWA